MKVNQRDLVLISFPFSDLKERKVRPALIISNNGFNSISDDCLMVPLTGVIRDIPYSILVSQKDLDSGKLIKESRIRVDKIFSIEKNQVFKKIGIVSESTFRKVKREFSNLI